MRMVRTRNVRILRNRRRRSTSHLHTGVSIIPADYISSGTLGKKTRSVVRLMVGRCRWMEGGGIIIGAVATVVIVVVAAAAKGRRSSSHLHHHHFGRRDTGMGARSIGKRG